MRAMLLGRTRHCNSLHNCSGSHCTIHLDSFLLRILHSSSAQGPQAGEMVPGSWAPVWAPAWASVVLVVLAVLAVMVGRTLTA